MAIYWIFNKVATFSIASRAQPSEVYYNIIGCLHSLLMSPDLKCGGGQLSSCLGDTDLASRRVEQIELTGGVAAGDRHGDTQCQLLILDQVTTFNFFCSL